MVANIAREGGGERGTPGSIRQSGPTKATMNNPYWTASTANFKKNWQNADSEKYWKSNFKMPFPNAPHDGGTQDQANTKYITDLTEKSNNYAYAMANKPTWVDQLALMTALATVSAGAGAAFAPAAGASLGSTVAAGAETGAVTGAAGAGLTGQNILKGALVGGVMGGIGSGLQGSGIGGSATHTLTDAGLNPSLAKGVVGGVIGAGTHAIGAGVTGGNIGNAAITGGVSGGLSGVTGSGTGSSTLGKLAGTVGAGAVGHFLGGTPSGGQQTGGNGGANFIGQGTSGNSMAGKTDSTLAKTIGGALPGVIQGAAGVYGSQNAAEKQIHGDQSAIAQQTSTLGNINGIWNPQQILGQRADSSLRTGLGLNGPGGPDYGGFKGSPGALYAEKMGTQAIQRQAASMGNAYTPNTAESIGTYVTGTAMQDYNNYISQLMGAAGLGSTANQALGDATFKTGENISQLQQNIGQAGASGVRGASDSVGGMFGPNGAGTSLIGAGANWLGQKFGGGGGGGGGKSGGGGGASTNPFGFGNGSFGSGFDPTTGQSWVGSGATDIPSFDPNMVSDPSTGMDFSGGGSTDFGGGLDYGSNYDTGFNFMGGP